MKINPEWQAAEDERLKIEEEYTNTRLAFQAVQDKWAKDSQLLNERIEATNQKVRSITQYLPEPEE